MNELKYPIIQAWVKSDNRMQWLDVDEIDYLEETFVIVDEVGNPHTYKLKHHDLRVSREVVTKL